MRRRTLLTGSLAAAALAPLACRPTPSRLEKLRVGAARRLTVSSLHLANESGYFQAAGFELEILPTGNPLSSMALLAGGKIEVYFGSIDTVFLNALLKGARVRIVAGREFASPDCGNVGAIYGLRKTFPVGLKDAAPLKGKRVAAGGGTGWGEFALDQHLTAAGLTNQDVQMVKLTTSQAVAALLGGGLDAMLSTDDLDRDPRVLIPDIVHTPNLSHLLPSFQYSYIYFGGSLLSGAPERGARFLAAFLRGAREFAEGKTPRYMVEFAKSNNLDVEETVKACRSTYAVDGAVNLDSLRRLAAWALRKRYVSRHIDVSEMVDDRPLKKAHEN